MNLKEFLKLPKRKNDPNDRMRKQIKKLRNQVDYVDSIGEHEEGEFKCCGKKTFKTKEEALSYKPTYNNKTWKPVRAYKCEQGNWHLSSITNKQIKERKKTWW